MCNPNRTLAFVIAVMLLSNAALFAQDWPQWRGPNRDATVTGFIAPKTWPKELAKKWKVAVGTGVSSPVLVGGKAYTFGRVGGDETTLCLDANTGKEIWRDKFATDPVSGAAAGYAGPRSTPVVAEGKVYTLGVHGTVSCLDAASGKLIWRKETGEEPQFSTSMSPIVADGKCIVFLGALKAYDAQSGEVKWTGPKGTPYGSPVLMTIGTTKMIATPTDKALVGINLADGKTVWQTKLFGSGYQASYPTPIVDGQTVIFGSSTQGGSTVALKIEKKGDEFTTSELWKSAGAYQYNTPVLKDGLLYGLSGQKKFFCMDAKDGKVLWTDTTARGEAGGILNAGSVILAVAGPAAGGGKGGGGKGAPSGGKGGKGGGKGFFGSETATGDEELIAFEPSGVAYKELAKYKLSPGTGLAYPIVTGNRVYVKGNDELTLWTLE